MDAAAVADLLDNQAGLLGVSGSTPDMAELLERRSRDLHAAEAVGLFCYQARKFVGALAAVLGGLDTLVFTGVSARTRRRCAGVSVEDLAFLGIELDPVRNDANAPIISREGALLYRTRDAHKRRADDRAPHGESARPRGSFLLSPW